MVRETRSTEGPQVRLIPANERLEVISQLLADHVAADPEIEQFRAAQLGGNLLTSDQVTEWIRQQAQQDGPVTQYAEVVLSADGQPLSGIQPESPRTRDLEYLDLRPRVPVHREQPTARGGVLDRLWYLSMKAANRVACLWSTAEATTFILTGTAPVFPQMRMRVTGTRLRVGAESTSQVELFLERVQMDIHPTVTVSEVAARYRQLSRELDRARRAKRPTMMLASFVDERRRERPNITWEEIRQAWNAAMPAEWAYSLANNLQRDYTRATRTPAKRTSPQ